MSNGGCNSTVFGPAFGHVLRRLAQDPAGKGTGCRPQHSAPCSQTFSFAALKYEDLDAPQETVEYTCGLDTDPETNAAYFDRDSRTGTVGAINTGAFADDWVATPGVVELHEGFASAYFTYQQIGFDGKLHAQKIERELCNFLITYADDMFPACGVGCGANMKVVRNWKLLDWCTNEIFEYVQIIKGLDQKAPTFDVKDHTISVDPWDCKAEWTVDIPLELRDNCAKSSEIKWGIKVAPGFEYSGVQPSYKLTGIDKGTHDIIYWAEDCCGNYTEKTSRLTVIDAAGPIPIAKQNIVLSLTGSGTDVNGAAKLYGWQIDQKSFDPMYRRKV